MDMQVQRTQMTGNSNVSPSYIGKVYSFL